MRYQFDHVAQQVPDIAEAIAWYQEHIRGVKVLYQDATWGFVDANGTRLAFVQRDQHPNHLAWRVSTEELERMAEKYNKQVQTHRDSTRSFYLEAPGGAWVEIIAVEGSSWAEYDGE